MPVNGYTRQAAANIQPGLSIRSGDLNNEFNAIQTAFSSTIGHIHDGTTGGGQQISLTASVTGVLPLANGGTGYSATGIDNLLIHFNVGSTSNANFNSVTTIAGVTTGTSVTVGTTLSVSGATTLQSLSATSGTFSSTLSSTGDFSVNTNKFTVTAANGNTSVAGTLGVTSDLSVNTNKFTVTAANGNTSVAGTLSVAGIATLASGSKIGSDLIDHFPSTTTKMLFYMSTAPVGWTQDVTNNDRVIRVVSGTGTGTGGSWTISGLSNSSTALTQANMPNYNLTVTDPGHIHGVTDPGHNHTVTDNSYFGGGGSSGVVGGPTGFNFPQISTNTTGISIQSHTTGITVSSGGSGTGHTHTPSSDGSWRPAYVDMIVCTKN